MHESECCRSQSPSILVTQSHEEDMAMVKGQETLVSNGKHHVHGS